MPSLPTPVTVSTSTPGAALLDLLQRVPDPRDPRGVRHPLPGLLGAAIGAVAAGARSFVAIGEWARDAGTDALTPLGLGHHVPDEATFRRVLARVDADLLDRLLGAWMFTRTATIGSRRVIAIDGKSVRGARHADGTMPHLVAGLDHATGAVLGQVAVTAKSNEIPAARTLLGCFDLNDVVVTMDAMHTQDDTATVITDAGGQYVFTVKNNRPRLRAALKKLPWKDIPSHRTVSIGHGRRATRTIKVATAPAWVAFPGAAQVAQIRRTVTRAGKKSIEVVYLVTSADPHQAPPATLASWVRGHWCIENRLHWVRDVTFDEDRSQIRTGQSPRVMATLRSVVISILRTNGWHNIAAALRHHSRHTEHALNLILTC